MEVIKEIQKVKDLFNTFYEVTNQETRVREIKRLNDVRILSTYFYGYYLVYNDEDYEDILETKLLNLVEHLEDQVKSWFNIKISKTIINNDLGYYYIFDAYNTKDSIKVQRQNNSEVLGHLECLKSIIEFYGNLKETK